MANMEALVKEFQSRLEETMKEHEALVDAAKAKYEAAIAEAQKELENAVASEKDTEVHPEQPAPQQQNGTPAAAWISAPDGERMMVINQDAVVMFMAIFDRMAEVATALQKLSNK